MIQNPNRDFPIANSQGVASDRFIGWIESVTNLLNALDVLEGAGSPEGVVSAATKKLYFDNVGLALYFKTTDITLNTGWVAL